MLLFESQARTSGASAGIFHTGHPCPDEKRPASLRAALRVFIWPAKRKADQKHGNGNGGIASRLLLGRSGASRDRATAITRAAGRRPRLQPPSKTTRDWDVAVRACAGPSPAKARRVDG